MTTVAGTSQYPQLALHSQYRFDEVVAAAGDSTGAEGGPAVAGVPAACPTLDLVATVTVGGGAGARELVLWRPGPGQVVSRSKGAPGVGGGRIGGAPERVEAVCWKPDGEDDRLPERGLPPVRGNGAGLTGIVLLRR